MSVSASVLPSSLAVEPGGEQSCWIQIRNTGEIVDEFVFEVLGDARDWAELDPPKLSLFPAAEGELKLTFRPPRRSTTPAGLVPFGLKVTSKQNPADTLVEEGKVAVAPFYDTGAELTPRTSHGRLMGRHELAFDNRGNTVVNGALEGFDPDNALTFAFKPPGLVAAPGSATFAKVRARPRKRFLRGQPKTLPFQVRVKPESGEPRVVDGAVVQEALIPKWLVPALLALGVLVVLWAALLKPTIQSTARDAVKAPLRKQQKQLDKANANAAAASAAAKQATAAAASAAEDAKIASGAATKATAKIVKIVSRQEVTNVAAHGTPTSVRLQSSCQPGQTCTVSYPVRKNQTFSLTDIVLGNPQGDTGALTLKNGDKVVLDESLQNFRDLDYHFIAPIVVVGGTKLAVVVQCTNQPATATTAGASAGAAPGEAATATPATGPCSAAASLAGFVQKHKASAQQPKP
jgi:hypothetical protein